MTRSAFFIFYFFFVSLSCPAQVNIDSLAFDSVKKDIQLNSVNGLVIMGETHDAKNTYQAEFFIIKDLLEKGYKTIFIEGGRSEAQIFNMYLKTGDTTVLRYTRAVNENKEFRSFMERLYELNKIKNAGIVFYGFDFERPVCINYLFHKWFADIITKDMGMNKNIELLLSITDYGDRTYKRINENSQAIKSVFATIKADFFKYEKQYHEILKDNFSVFKAIVFNPSFFKTTGDMQRDQWMADAMLKYENEVGLGGSIIITGTFHIVNKNRFIPRLLKETKSEYAVIAFIPVYKNCTMLDQRPYKFSSESSLLRCLKEKPGKPVITFSNSTEKLIPSGTEINATILVGFYDQ